MLVSDPTRSAAVADAVPLSNVRMRPVLLAVGIVAVLVNVLSLSASNLWVHPDSWKYIELGAGIAERFDFSNEFFVVRTPGYPLLLGCVFRLFGAYSEPVLMLVQHGMVAGMALLTALTAWHLSGRRSVALIAGLLCACNLHLLAYANMVMSEVPFTLMLLVSVYFLVRYHRYGVWRHLILASLAAGVSYQFRPIGFLMVGFCGAVVLHRLWRQWRRLAVGAGLAVAPALAAAGPWLIHNAAVFQDEKVGGSFLGLAFYQRTAGSEGLSSTKSPMFLEVRATFDQAKAMGVPIRGGSFRHSLGACDAYVGVYGMSFAEAMGRVGQAGEDLMWEHLGLMVWRALPNTARTLLVPDPSYRFHPGGVKGVGWRLAPGADIFDSATYEPVSRRHLVGYRHYLPLRDETHATTWLWAAVNRWFYHHIEKGSPIVGVRDSPHEEFMVVCLLGGVLSLGTRRRVGWLLVGGVIATQLMGSVFLNRPDVRYLIPIQPFLMLFPALFMVLGAGAVVRAVRACRPSGYGQTMSPWQVRHSG